MRHALSDPTPRTDPPDDLEHPDAIEASPQSTAVGAAFRRSLDAMGCRVLTCDSCQTRKQFSGMHYTAGRRYCGSCLRAVGVRWAKDIDNDLLLANQGSME